MKGKVVMLVGSSGLVGSHVLAGLLAKEHIHEVRILVRRPTSLVHDKLKNFVTQFDGDYPEDDFFNVDALYCCIGTTRKKTPDLNQYWAIDFGIPMEVAKRVKSQGCSEIHLVSSLGAKASSKNFYLKIKGETEEGIESLGFESTFIYRPALLIGKRKEARILENIGQKLSFVFDILSFGGKYHSMKVSLLAQTMLTVGSKNGIFHLYYPDCKTLVNTQNL